MNAGPAPRRTRSARVQALAELVLQQALETIATLRNPCASGDEMAHARNALVRAAVPYFDAVQEPVNAKRERELAGK